MPSRATDKVFREFGAGPALVLIPGIQGRWEWMRQAVDALARQFRVVTFSLEGERGTGGRPTTFESYPRQVDAALAFAHVERAILCGVSYGGLIAVRYAATRPARLGGLVLVSAPGPSWRPDARVREYARAPRAHALSFVAGAPVRLAREISAAVPALGPRAAAAAGYLREILLHPTSPSRMAERVRCVDGCDFVRDARAVRAPTLVITGEPALDRVVPVAGTREYLDLIPGAVGATLERTGHIGLVTRPNEFARIITEWAQSRKP